MGSYKGVLAGVLVVIVYLLTPASVSSQNFGDLQFVGFEASKLSGLLEFNFGGLWFTICNDGFGLKEAAVACRQLGLGYPVTVFNQDEGKNESQYHRFGFGFGAHILTNVNCLGNETHLMQCNYSTQTPGCGPYEAVGLQCSDYIPEPYPGQIRLVDGSYPSEGLLEIYLNGEWGAVCGSIDQNMANTACRQLGYAGTATSNVVAGSSSAWITSVSCPSTQTCLTSCLSSVPTAKLPDCGPQNYTRITCSSFLMTQEVLVGNKELCSNITSTPPDGSLRLIGGSNSAGVVQIYKNGEWGSVCGIGLDFKAPEVICRQLGYTTGHNFGLIEFDWDGPILVSAASCNGGENRLDECKLYNASQMECPSVGEQLYIICDTSFNVPPFGSLTLVGGDGGSGDLFVNNGFGFLPICDRNFDQTAADVACRQLGYKEALAVRRGSYYHQFPAYKPFSNFANISDVSCNGAESNLLQCSHKNELNNQCNLLNIVGIQCGINRGDLRLSGGNTSSGTLEWFLDGLWQPVCYNGFNKDAANVACTQLGFGTVNQYTLNMSISGSLAIIGCDGSEKKLYDCFHSPILNAVCGGGVELYCEKLIIRKFRVSFVSKRGIVIRWRVSGKELTLIKGFQINIYQTKDNTLISSISLSRRVRAFFTRLVNKGNEKQFKIQLSNVYYE